MKSLNKIKSAALLMISLGIFNACSDQYEEIVPDESEEETVVAVNEYAYVNQWIYDEMDLYYLWKDELPADADLNKAPEEFFESLLFTYDESTNPEGDRYSFISNDADALLAEFSGESLSTGIEFRLFYKGSTGDDIIAQIIYIIKDSPAEDAGLQRGDIVTRINGETLNVDNYAELLFDNDAFIITLADYSNGTFVEQPSTVSLAASVLQENPIYLDSIYEINGTKVGYLVYNQFIPGPYNSITADYDDELIEIFSSFKSSGINELVIDLRYNPGGYASSAVTMASLIGSGVNSGSLFYEEEYNDEFQNYLESYYGSDYFSVNFEDYTANIGNQIGNVYFLVSNYTASSSELLINGLKPYMNVILIGEQTYGKNVGSFTITDDSSEDNTWALQPIVVKAYNSLGESDYTAGFIPDVEIYESLDLIPFGDIEDPLLGQAINMATGSTARIMSKTNQNIPEIIDLSTNHKRTTMKHISQ